MKKNLSGCIGYISIVKVLRLKKHSKQQDLENYCITKLKTP